MRAVFVAAMVTTLATSSIALAEPWKATAALVPDAPMACRQADVSKVVFDFVEQGDQLVGKTTDGHSFTAPVATDGTVSTSITVPVGGKDFAVELTGNAKSRELQVLNRKYACRFTLTPIGAP